jgi:replicative DNA helicase
MDDMIREQSFERALPNSAEAERAILGAIVLDNGLIAQAIEQLKPDDFYVPSHRRIFIAMIALFERGAEINPILIGEELKKENALESVGGVSFITNLSYGLPHSTNIMHYAKVVLGKSSLRQLIKAANKITQEALAEEDDPEIILDHAEQQIFAVAEKRVRSQFVHVEPLAEIVIERAKTGPGPGCLSGLPTGFADLDKMLSGLQLADLIILAARPSMGKTSFALMLAENVAKLVEGAVVGVFSLEMSKEALVARMLCGHANLDAQRFRNGMLSSNEKRLLDEAKISLSKLRIFLDDPGLATVLDLRAKSRRLAAEQKRLDLIIVDYLQLMAGSAKRHESRQQEISQISRELKGLAKELNVPLVALSQLSRAPEQRSDHRPQLSDLRESGALEQDADVVSFIFRPDQYIPMEDRVHSEHRNRAELIIAKQRNGPTGTVDLRFTPSSMRFDNIYKER